MTLMARTLFIQKKKVDSDTRGLRYPLSSGQTRGDWIRTSDLLNPINRVKAASSRLLEARVLADQWRQEYNHEWPHSAMDYMTTADAVSGRRPVRRHDTTNLALSRRAAGFSAGAATV
jgi:transposase InsO family protein